MTPNPEKAAHRPFEPLASRHVFLDTEAYRALGHNPANRAMTLLKEQVASHRVVLHTADITLLEVRRQIRELVLAKHRELGSIEKDFRRWRKVAPTHVPATVQLDTDTLSHELFEQFRSFLCHDCKAEVHNALEVPAAVVFKAYFDRKPPFDGEDSKEFPDGFVIEALSKWCQKRGDHMHIVTRDEAMIRAGSTNGGLIPLRDVHELLARAAADLGAEGERAAEEVFDRREFDRSLKTALSRQLSEATFVYIGDLADGEAYEGELLNVEDVNDWSVVGLNDRRVTLILTVKVNVRVEVQYEDRDDAFHDEESGRWHWAEIASRNVDDDVTIEVLIDVERSTGTVREAKVLTPEVFIEGRRALY